MEDERVFLYDGETVRMSRMRTEQEARELARHNTHMIYFFAHPLDLLKAEMEKCKHCGVGIKAVEEDSWIHENNLYRCQSSDVPYGHLAEPVGQLCRADGPNPCLGAFTKENS